MNPEDTTWPPLTQEWPEESNIKIIPPDQLPPINLDTTGLADRLPDIDTDPDIERTWQPPQDKIRHQILDRAHTHIALALTNLHQAIAWLNVVDPKDRTATVRTVEAVAETIDYRRSL